MSRILAIVCTLGALISGLHATASEQALAERLQSTLAIQRSRAALVSASGIAAPQVTPPVDVSALAVRLRAIIDQLKLNALQPNPAAQGPARNEALADLLRAVPGAVVHLRPNGTVQSIRGNDLFPQALTASGAANASLPANFRAVAFVQQHRALFQLDDPAAELKSILTESDDLGHTRVLLQQHAAGLPIWPCRVAVEFDSAQRLISVVGAYVPTPVLNGVEPRLTPEQAFRHAQRRLPTTWTPERELSELVVFGPLQGQPRLAWKCEFVIGLAHAWRVLVAADDGRVLLAEDRTCDLNVVGSGLDLTGASRALNVWKAGNTFYLIDTSKGSFVPGTDPVADPKGAITIVDARNQPLDALDNNLFHVTSASANTWTVPAAISAAYNFSETYDYFTTRHNRNSIDGQGGNITAVVRVGFDNAFWNGGLSVMVFGNAKPYPASLDVIAHELSHGVTEKSANLIYQNQPGALNEAFSDILGEMTEARTRGDCDWRVGSDLGVPIRDMQNPGTLQWSSGKSYPDRMSRFVNLPNTEDGDYGGVHINSSIINQAFYLLARGLPNALGLRDAERIFYRTLTQKLLPQSQFIDARLGAIASAEDLFGPASAQAQATAAAFDRVEIGAAPATPDPSPVPIVSGKDSNLHVYEIAGAAGSTFDLYRNETALGDGAEGRHFFENISLTRPAVSGDGELVAFVTANHDIAFAETQSPSSAVLLGLDPLVHSVALSPDGHWIALIFRNANTGEPIDQISLIDLVGNEDKTFQLVAPNIEGISVDQILYADAITFSTDSRNLVYDALSRVHFAGGGAVAKWSIFSIDIASGVTSIVVPPIDGISTGNPSLGRAGSRYLALDAQSETDLTTAVFVLDLFSGDVALIRGTGTSLGYPAFTGDEAALVYAAPDGNIFGSGYSLFRQALTPDRLQAVGDPTVFQSDARLGVVFRRGSFAGTNALPSVIASLSTNTLTLPGNVVLRASANDPDGTVQGLQFFAGSTRLGDGLLSGGQFSFIWNNPAPGTYRITARAIDNLGGAGDSAPVELTVRSAQSAPRLALLNANGASLQFQITGPAGNYELERSLDLKDWQQIRSLTLDGSGTSRLDQAMEPAPASAAFYRLRQR